MSKPKDTTINILKTTRTRLKNLPTESKNYDPQLNELMDFWEKNRHAKK